MYKQNVVINPSTSGNVCSEGQNKENIVDSNSYEKKGLPQNWEWSYWQRNFSDEELDDVEENQLKDIERAKKFYLKRKETSNEACSTCCLELQDVFLGRNSEQDDSDQDEEILQVVWYEGDNDDEAEKLVRIVESVNKKKSNSKFTLSVEDEDGSNEEVDSEGDETGGKFLEAKDSLELLGASSRSLRSQCRWSDFDQEEQVSSVWCQEDEMTWLESLEGELGKLDKENEEDLPFDILEENSKWKIQSKDIADCLRNVVNKVVDDVDRSKKVSFYDTTKQRFHQLSNNSEETLRVYQQLKSTSYTSQKRVYFHMLREDSSIYETDSSKSTKSLDEKPKKRVSFLELENDEIKEHDRGKTKKVSFHNLVIEATENEVANTPSMFNVDYRPDYASKKALLKGDADYRVISCYDKLNNTDTLSIEEEDEGEDEEEVVQLFDQEPTEFPTSLNTDSQNMYHEPHLIKNEINVRKTSVDFIRCNSESRKSNSSQKSGESVKIILNRSERNELRDSGEIGKTAPSQKDKEICKLQSNSCENINRDFISLNNYKNELKSILNNFTEKRIGESTNISLNKDAILNGEVKKSLQMAKQSLEGPATAESCTVMGMGLKPVKTTENLKFTICQTKCLDEMSSTSCESGPRLEETGSKVCNNLGENMQNIHLGYCFVDYTNLLSDSNEPVSDSDSYETTDNSDADEEINASILEGRRLIEKEIREVNYLELNAASEFRSKGETDRDKTGINYNETNQGFNIDFRSQEEKEICSKEVLKSSEEKSVQKQKENIPNETNEKKDILFSVGNKTYKKEECRIKNKDYQTGKKELDGEFNRAKNQTSLNNSLKNFKHNILECKEEIKSKESVELYVSDLIFEALDRRLDNEVSMSQKSSDFQIVGETVASDSHSIDMAEAVSVLDEIKDNFKSLYKKYKGLIKVKSLAKNLGSSMNLEEQAPVLANKIVDEFASAESDSSETTVNCLTMSDPSVSFILNKYIFIQKPLDYDIPLFDLPFGLETDESSSNSSDTPVIPDLIEELRLKKGRDVCWQSSSGRRPTSPNRHLLYVTELDGEFVCATKTTKCLLQMFTNGAQTWHEPFYITYYL